jgi:uncharacterized SAM-binding protein YcdF (DUF218 family)
MLQAAAKFLINPLLFVWAGLLTLLFFRHPRKRYLIAFNLFFYLCTIPFTGWLFQRVWGVDDTFNPDFSYDAAIVLSGFSNVSWYTRQQDDFFNAKNYFNPNENGERILAGIRLVKSGHAKKLLLAEDMTGSFNEADMAREFGLRHGLGPHQIQIYGRIENTRDEANAFKVFSTQDGLGDTLLITSQRHMRRARALFRRQGLIPHTYSVNRPGGLDWNSFVPGALGIGMTQAGLYELVGYAAYWATGDI